MKLHVTQENLAKALSNVARIASSGRNQLPILSHVLLRTVDNQLSIIATNLEIAITEHIGAKILDDGAIAVPARLMHDFVAGLPSGNIELELKDTKLLVKADRFSATIHGALADEFPALPGLENGTVQTVEAQEFKKSLQQVLFAASSDDTRPILAGVLLYTDNNSLYAAATDSYRLSEKRLADQQVECRVLVPATALQDLLRVISDGLERITIESDEQQIVFRAGNIELVSRLIDGKYPDYRKLLPVDFAVRATLSRQEFISITKISSLFARGSAGSVTIDVSEEDQRISISSVASQVGENTSFAVGEVHGSGQITLNSRYLLDGLQAITGDKVLFGFNGKLDPCMLRSATSEDYLHIVMPLKS